MKINLLLFFMACGVVMGQIVTFKGRVISEKAQPIFGANIILDGTQTGAAANDNGYFEVANVAAGNYSIHISAIGFEKKTITNFRINSSTKLLTVVLVEKVIEQEQVIVSAGKHEQNILDLTVSTVIIRPNEIEEKNIQTFDELLRHIPGVQVNLEQVSIRGSSGYSKGTGARVLVALNGLPIFSGDNGDIVWEMIPTTDIERIEVIKGPASSLYGTSAIGGVINIITNSMVKKPITHFRTYFGLYDHPSYELWDWSNSYRQFYGAEITHSNSIDNFGYTFSLKKFDNDSYRSNDFQKRNLAYVKLNYKVSENDKLTLFANYLNMNRGNYLYWGDSRQYALIDTSSRHNTVKSNRLFSGLIYEHTFSEKLTGEVKSSFYRSKFDGYGLEVTTSEANLFRTEVLTNYQGTDNFTLTSGAEFSYADISSNIFKTPTFIGGGAYSQAEIKFSTGLIATLGLRWDILKLDTLAVKNAFTPRAGLNYKVSQDLVLRASVGTGFRAPTPAEVFTSTAVGGGISIKENPNLTSESSLSFEAGCIYNLFSNLNFDLAFFQTDYNNFIEPNLQRDGDIQFVNISKARVQGIELLANWNVFSSIDISTGYNYMWARDLDFNKPMKYRPQNSVHAQVRYSNYPFDASIDFRYSSRVEAIDDLITTLLVKDGQLRVPIYVTDVNFGYNFLLGSIPAKIFVSAKNIFNYNYVEFIGNIAPIRNISLSTDLYF